MHPNVHGSIIYNSHHYETAKMPISRIVGKNVVVHLHNRILLSYKKVGNLTFCDCMDGPGKYYAKWISQSEKDKYHIILIICGIYEQNKLLNKIIKTDS